jgi:hypothetical protein
MLHYLVGFIIAAPWIVGSFNLIKVAVEPNFLCPHLDEDRGLGFIREGVIEFINMLIKGYAVSVAIFAMLAFLIEHASDAIPLVPSPGFPGEAANLSFIG